MNFLLIKTVIHQHLSHFIFHVQMFWPNEAIVSALLYTSHTLVNLWFLYASNLYNNKHILYLLIL